MGSRIAALIASPSEWINRQVETIELLSHEETRRRVSIDFTLPVDAKNAFDPGYGILVPLGILTKERRKNFDLRDETGSSLPVLGRSDNEAVAHSAILTFALKILEDAETPAKYFDELAEILWNIVVRDAAFAIDSVEALLYESTHEKKWLRSLFDDERFSTLLVLLARGYLLIAVLPEAKPRRRVIKVSYGTDFDPIMDAFGSLIRVGGGLHRLGSPDRQVFAVDCSMALWGGSYHLEVAIPEELRVDFATFTITDRAGMRTPVGEQEINVNRVSLYAPQGIAENMPFDAYLEIIPERFGQVFQGLGLGILVTLTLTCGLLFGIGENASDSAVSILLTGAALFSGLSASSGNHVLVRQVFSGTRWATVLVALAAVLGSLTFSIDFPGWLDSGTLWVAFGIGFLATTRLLASWKLAASDAIASDLDVEES